MLKDLYQITAHLNTITHPLRGFLPKKVAFDWTETCNEVFEKLNNDTCFSHFDKSVSRV